MRPLFWSELRIGHGKTRAPAEHQAVVGGEAKVVDEVLRCDVGAAMRQQALHERGIQRLGRNDESAYRHHATAQVRERARARIPRRQQHLPGIDASACTGHAEAAVGLAVQLGHRRMFGNACTVSRSSVREPDTELAHVHLRTGLLQQAAEEFAGSRPRPGCRPPAPSRRADRLRGAAARRNAPACRSAAGLDASFSLPVRTKSQAMFSCFTTVSTVSTAAAKAW